ncbi:MAG TPA: hypothetical protein VHN39_09960 [Phenylobacterium sp.]|jgi:uncharacterized membrane protein|nr:hypothetical protein [Phenylobacterium sp.]
MTGQYDYGATEDRTMPAVAYALFLLGFVSVGITSLVGLIMALSNQGQAGPMARSHYTFLTRTFWMGFVWSFLWGCLFGISIPLSFILIGIPLLILSKLMLSLGVVWYGVRCIVGVVFLAQGEPYPRPYSWLI